MNMVRRLPPLNQVRAFEAAARHGSFKQAANELNVTQAAVGHQVKALEDFLGCSLFHRVTRGVRPTVEAERYQRFLADAFEIIETATDEVRSGLVAGQFTVSVAPSFGTRWLLPRSQSFEKSHPEIELKLEITHEVIDFGEGRIDAAIRHGRGGWQGLEARLLFEEELVAVAAPELAASGLDPAKLGEQCRLLSATPRNDEWPAWFTANGHAPEGTLNIVEFPTLGLVIDAAVSGQGIALADRRLVANDLAVGKLVSAQHEPFRQGRGLYLVYPQRDTRDQRITAFHDWLTSELESWTAESTLYGKSDAIPNLRG